MSFENRSRRRCSSRSRRDAFSLMELMVVLLIIGLLSAAVTVGIRGARENGRRTTANLEITNIVNGLEMYNSVTASYPSQAEGLEVLLEPIGDYSSGILKKKGELNDPWRPPR